MPLRKLSLFAACGLFMSCAFAEEPIARFGDPANDQVNAEAFKAGTTQLGSEDDVAVIKELLKTAHPKMKVRSIRGASASKEFARAKAAT